MIAKFPSMEAARAWYDGETYREARLLRKDAVLAKLYIVDGID